MIAVGMISVAVLGAATTRLLSIIEDRVIRWRQP
jgi:ABC-type nitrate/sulfonate/bicarbonate transport system permease component